MVFTCSRCMPTATAGHSIFADSTRKTRSAHKQEQSITLYECLSPALLDRCPTEQALDIRKVSSNGTLHLISPSFHFPPTKKKKNSFRLHCSGAPLGAPLDGKRKKKKGESGRVSQKKKRTMTAMTHADRQSVWREVRLGFVHFGTSMSRSAQAAMCDMPRTGANLRKGHLEPAFAHLSSARDTVTFL